MFSTLLHHRYIVKIAHDLIRESLNKSMGYYFQNSKEPVLATVAILFWCMWSGLIIRIKLRHGAPHEFVKQRDSESHVAV